jgi:acetyltransferase-like isoleucine patch superfamily enzyme
MQQTFSGNSVITANKIIIGPNCHIGKNVRINVRGTFELGRCSAILDNCIIDCQDFIAGEYLFMSKNVEVGRGGCQNPEAIVTIGKGVGIFENTIINPNSTITIGDYTGIGAEVMLWTHGAWLDATQGYPADFGPITIGSNVWLPARSIMLPNTSIGNDTVIGIGSTITKSIPSNCMAAGTPCKVLKSNCYPVALTDNQLEDLINPILDRWNTVLVPQKSINSVTSLSYDSKSRHIILSQGSNTTIYDIFTKNISGYENDVSEDLRDFLRRNGIKFFTSNPFKSI